MSKHHHHVDWKHLAIYGLLVALVVGVGGVAIWSFIERQSLVVVSEPLPKVTVVTQDPHSRLAAAWVRLLTRAEMAPTLVTVDEVDSLEGVVFFCDIARVPAKFSGIRAAAFAGAPPATAAGPFHLAADAGVADNTLHLSESVSPLLARLMPGTEFQSRPVPVALLTETPQMVVDARWDTNARAAVMHLEEGGARCVWFGFDPDALANPEDNRLLLLMRTSFRWVAGQPISEGAVGALTPEGRKRARAERFTFSVERLSNPRMLSIRMANRGTVPLDKPTVKVWLPPDVTEVALAGDLIMKRGATLLGDPDQGACQISLRSLGRNEDRIMKLKVVKERPRAVPNVALR